MPPFVNHHKQEICTGFIYVLRDGFVATVEPFWCECNSYGCHDLLCIDINVRVHECCSIGGIMGRSIIASDDNPSNLIVTQVPVSREFIVDDNARQCIQASVSFEQVIMSKYAERIIRSRIRCPRLLWSGYMSKIFCVRACM